MAITQISVDTEDAIKVYTSLTTDSIDSYPLDCPINSRMSVINPIDGHRSGDLIFDGVHWIVINDKTEIKDVVDTEIIYPIGSPANEFTIDMEDKFVKNVRVSCVNDRQQIDTNAVVGTITLAGNAEVIFTGAGVTGSPITLNVAVALNDTASIVAGKIATALSLNAAISALYTITSISNEIFVTRTIPAANDTSLNLSVNNGTCTGLTPSLTSTNSQLGGTYDKTMALINVPNITTLHMEFNYAVATTVAFFSGITFDVTPTFVAGNEYVFEFYTRNGGTSWKGIQIDNKVISTQTLVNPTITGGNISATSLVIPFGTPVAPVTASGRISFLGVVIDAETVTIGDDVYEFCADTAQTVVGDNIPMDITTYMTASSGTLTVDTNPTVAVASTGTLTVDTNPIEGDTMTIGTTVYTFVDSDDFDTAGEIPIDNTLDETQISIVAAVNGTDGINTAHTLVTMGDFAANDSIITAIEKGTSGDAIATTETFDAVTNIFAAGTLGSGVDADTMTIGTKTYTFVPTADFENDGEIPVGTLVATTQASIVDAINGDDTINTAHTLVTAGAFAVNVSTITAIIAGTSGDTIATTETFATGTNTFGGAVLAGGADCTAANAVTALALAITSNATSPVTGVDSDADSVLCTAKVAGVAANSIATDTDAENGLWANTTLISGVDGTIGAKGQFMFDATYFYVSVDVSTISTSYWEKSQHA